MIDLEDSEGTKSDFDNGNSNTQNNLVVNTQNSDKHLIEMNNINVINEVFKGQLLRKGTYRL